MMVTSGTILFIPLGFFFCSCGVSSNNYLKQANDTNYGDTKEVNGSGDDVIISSNGNDTNYGDTQTGQESSGDDNLTGNGGRDIFICGKGEDTVTDYNAAEGDIATPDCENINPPPASS